MVTCFVFAVFDDINGCFPRGEVVAGDRPRGCPRRFPRLRFAGSPSVTMGKGGRPALCDPSWAVSTRPELERSGGCPPTGRVPGSRRPSGERRGAVCRYMCINRYLSCRCYDGTRKHRRPFMIVTLAGSSGAPVSGGLAPASEPGAFRIAEVPPAVPGPCRDIPVTRGLAGISRHRAPGRDSPVTTAPHVIVCLPPAGEPPERLARRVGAYPPAMAPTTMNGSAPVATGSGSGASGGSWDRSCSQAKNRTNGRRR